ncbi:isochorismatase hydrolase [Hyphomonas adhaerens MHS-3]|uniref:Isochorismatase hydrolase n=1 Tax=Hyphomonas adhaerens MHS-3 TaxID=1280949 RepID=A0A069E000_9PROT|nr:isochorismatase family protein [Hyphomonas adhaerens]KCZ82605.1 isochorismatase hydrolase [Hyphomonas adhaerens MHS-3]
MTTPTQPAIGINDVLATSFVNPKAPPAATLDNTALLLIDIQHLAEPSYHVKNAVAAGLPEDAVQAALSDYEVRFNAAVVQAARVLDAARSAGIPPIHVKIQALSCQGRDTSQLHSRLGWNFPPGSPATEFLEPTRPKADEIVITKTASGAFTGTSLDTTLRNMGIEHLIVVGFMTDECVETTTRVALDYGYISRVVSDATTTYHLESYQSTIGKLASYGFTLTADEAIADMKAMAEQA